MNHGLNKSRSKRVATIIAAGSIVVLLAGVVSFSIFWPPGDPNPAQTEAQWRRARKWAFPRMGAQISNGPQLHYTLRGLARVVAGLEVETPKAAEGLPFPPCEAFEPTSGTLRAIAALSTWCRRGAYFEARSLIGDGTYDGEPIFVLYNTGRAALAFAKAPDDIGPVLALAQAMRGSGNVLSAALGVKLHQKAIAWAKSERTQLSELSAYKPNMNELREAMARDVIIGVDTLARDHHVRAKKAKRRGTLVAGIVKNYLEAIRIEAKMALAPMLAELRNDTQIPLPELSIAVDPAAVPSNKVLQSLLFSRKHIARFVKEWSDAIAESERFLA